MDNQSNTALFSAAISGIIAASVSLSGPINAAPPTPDPAPEKTTTSTKKKSEKTFKCLGVNACKGQGDCGEIVAGKLQNKCMGMNSCKGKSFKWVKNKQICDALKVAKKTNTTGGGPKGTSGAKTK